MSSRRFTYLGVFFIMGLSCLPAPADADYAAQLIESAETQHLQDASEWHALLHYQPDWLGHGYTSEAVTPAFFLAPEGRKDPRLELEATIRSFFATPASSTDDSSQCLFIARYHWLKQKLRFDTQRLTEYPCPSFDHWYATINPSTLVLIFPSAYLNNPSSMYGHTFLRFDHPDQPEETHLESYAVNFAAQTRDTNGVVFAFKGLTGLYAGAFTLEPYYQKVKDYSDIENRDIWEYELNYSPAEIRFILEHIWELRQVAFPYYFLNRNCSYALLGLLDVARPSSQLVRGFYFQAIPSDTVKVILAQHGILRRTVYRPSLLSRVKNHLRGMSITNQRLALKLERGQIEALDPSIVAFPQAQRADIYDTANDYLLYQSYRGDLSRDIYGPRSLAILLARSRLIDAPTPAPVPAPDTNPVDGHGSSRFAFALGNLDGDNYAETDLRAAYHDLLDPAPGFVDGAEIEMFGMGMRTSLSRNDTRLEHLNLMNIRSLTPRDLFFKPLSWQFGAGWDHEWINADKRPLVGNIHGGVGFTWQPDGQALFFMMANVALLTNGGIPKGYDLGIGPELGLIWPVSPRWNMSFDAGYIRYARNLGFTSVRYSLDQNFMLTKMFSLRLDLSREGDVHAPVNGVSLSLLWYF